MDNFKLYNCTLARSGDVGTTNHSAEDVRKMAGCLKRGMKVSLLGTPLPEGAFTLLTWEIEDEPDGGVKITGIIQREGDND